MRRRRSHWTIILFVIQHFVRCGQLRHLGMGGGRSRRRWLFTTPWTTGTTGTTGTTSTTGTITASLAPRKQLIRKPLQRGITASVCRRYVAVSQHLQNFARGRRPFRHGNKIRRQSAIGEAHQAVKGIGAPRVGGRHGCSYGIDTARQKMVVLPRAKNGRAATTCSTTR